MQDQFMTRLYRELQKSHPLATLWIDGKCNLSLPEQLTVVARLFETACKSQNVGHIVASRNVLSKIPVVNLRELIPSAVGRTLDLDDEWEFRRLLEVLQVVSQPEQLAHYIVAGKSSSNPDVREAALEFDNACQITCLTHPPASSSPRTERLRSSRRRGRAKPLSSPDGGSSR